MQVKRRVADCCSLFLHPGLDQPNYQQPDLDTTLAVMSEPRKVSDRAADTYMKTKQSGPQSGPRTRKEKTARHRKSMSSR